MLKVLFWNLNTISEGTEMEDWLNGVKIPQEIVFEFLDRVYREIRTQ